MDTAHAPTAAPFASLPQPLQLSCLRVLPLKDMLAFDSTSHGMRRLCGDDVLWQPLYEDIAHRCSLEGVGHSSVQQQRDLEQKQQQILHLQQQQTSYKRKTLQYLMLFFGEGKKHAAQIIENAIIEEREDYYNHRHSPDPFWSDYEGDGTPDFDDFEPTLENWGEEEWAAEEKVAKLSVRIKAITKVLQQQI